MKYLEKAVKAYVKQNSDTFSKVLDKALKQRKGKYQNARLILEALLDFKEDQFTFSQILSKIRERKKQYPSSNLSLYLKPLTVAENSEIIRYDHNADKYSFSSPFFKAFVLMRFDSEKGKLKKEALKQLSNDDFLMAYSEYIAKLTTIQEEYIRTRRRILEKKESDIAV